MRNIATLRLHRENKPCTPLPRRSAPRRHPHPSTAVGSPPIDSTASRQRLLGRKAPLNTQIALRTPTSPHRRPNSSTAQYLVPRPLSGPPRATHTPIPLTQLHRRFAPLFLASPHETPPPPSFHIDHKNRNAVRSPTSAKPGDIGDQPSSSNTALPPAVCSHSRAPSSLTVRIT
jgi:hypothetical protein